MIAVLTGDVVNSKIENAEVWLQTLKSTLELYGKTPRDWEVFRGDSFQLVVSKEKAILASIHIKSAIKQFEDLDVRIGIGLGKQNYKSNQITESNGPAFVRSGESFDTLKKQQMILKSDNKTFDDTINLMLCLSLLTADRWSPTVAKIIKLSIENPNLKQKDRADKLNKSQSSISEALKRGGFDEMMMMNNYYKNRVAELC
ncbi:SatD family protein [Mesohalobacter halotolerans]|uniref:Transcriptional regulator n=1 Tax=Mesohalobacter halotolerans TaxID=1883405 RepID=A0A4U5TSK0_9FLAO|nr:SatD family protein [Mesohalobacter halotolerans]TKS57116.1 transcriptional regulator [Mesohalobacter halotolerans]